jgi:SAM-dependent methyltransferase
MKPFELIYLCCEPGLPALYPRVRKTLLNLSRGAKAQAHVLDIGGRKSHYTIGIPAKVTISELERQSNVQRKLNLGMTEEISSQIQRRRSNIDRVMIDDMTRSSLASNSFDYAIAVEVLEHVEDDAAFVREVRRVLKPNGIFIITTPNGDFVSNTNPDHKRHYRAASLKTLLRKEFDYVDVQYAIPSGKFYDVSLQSWSFRRPFRTMLAVAGGILNSIEDRLTKPTLDGSGMQELIATARRSV